MSFTSAYRGAGYALAAALALAADPSSAITGSTSTTTFAAVGVGVQVAPDWVLTVSHDVIAAGSAYSNGYGTRNVVQTFLAPGAAFPANDLALMELAPDPSSGAPFMPIDASLPWDMSLPLPIPTAATIVSTANATPGPRGYAFTTITQFAQTYAPDPAKPQATVDVNWLLSIDASVHVQGSDSGGGLFAGNVSDSSTLLGLSSALLQDARGNPVGSAFVQPAAYRGWIDATVASATPGESLLWVSAVPEPDARWNWLVGLALLAWLRRAGVPASLARAS
jgi:hypothetical protein